MNHSPLFSRAVERRRWQAALLAVAVLASVPIVSSAQGQASAPGAASPPGAAAATGAAPASASASASGSTSAVGGDKAQAQLRDFVTGTQSARGEFTQRSARANGTQAESGTGAFWFSRPGRFRWEVRTPYEQLMLADAQKLYFFDKDLNQVTVRKLGDALGASPAAILFGTDALERNFTLKEAGERDGLDWLDALPKSKDAGFDRILIGFRGGLPQAMEVRDAFGKVTLFAFRNLERNPKLDAELFRFVAPKGADVVQQ